MTVRRFSMINDFILKRYCSFKSMMAEERGDIVQTSIIIGILAILAIGVLTMLRDPIRDVFDSVKAGLVDAL